MILEKDYKEYVENNDMEYLDLNSYDAVFHISHTDLDGYGCHTLTIDLLASTGRLNLAGKEIDDTTSLHLFNLSYGHDFKSQVDQILEYTKYRYYGKVLVLITDLNLPLDTSDYITEAINKFNSKYDYKVTVDLKLVDHHKTGIESAEKHDWYLMNTSISATKFYSQVLNLSPTNQILNDLVLLVDTYDMWKADSKIFNHAKFMNGLIYNSSMLPKSLLINNVNIKSLFYSAILTTVLKDIRVDKLESSYDENNFIKLPILENTQHDTIVEMIRKFTEYLSIGEIIDDSELDYIYSNILNDDSLSFMDKMTSMVYRVLRLFIIKSMTTFDTDKYGTVSFIMLPEIGMNFNQPITQYLRDDDFTYLHPVVLMSVTHNSYSKELYYSFRTIDSSSGKSIDVADLAKTYFDGGGHSTASGGKSMFKSTPDEDKFNFIVMSGINGDIINSDELYSYIKSLISKN